MSSLSKERRLAATKNGHKGRENKSGNERRKRMDSCQGRLIVITCYSERS